MNQATDRVIIGGGVGGCSIAYHLSKAGVRVRVFEREEIAAEAVSGVQVEYHRTGSLHVVTDQDEEAHLRRYEQAWRARGAEVAWVKGDALRRAEPLLNPEISIALSIPHAASIRPRLMTRAYAEAARRLGALISEQTEVIGFQRSGSKVTAIQTKQGEVIACERVVIAAGAWSAQVGSWLGLDIPVFPARGQILSLWQPATPLQHTIFGREIYVVPKVDHTIYGTALLGSG